MKAVKRHFNKIKAVLNYAYEKEVVEEFYGKHLRSVEKFIDKHSANKKLVKYVNQYPAINKLTIGNIYEVVHEDGNMLIIKNNTGGYRNYSVDRFEEVHKK